MAEYFELGASLKQLQLGARADCESDAPLTTWPRCLLFIQAYDISDSGQGN